MKDPMPVNLTTSAEAQAQGWAGEARDGDGHLISTIAPGEDAEAMGEWVLEWSRYPCTVTVFPRQ